MRGLEWWASGGLKANRISPWCPPKPTLHMWSDASMHARVFILIVVFTFSTPGQNRRQGSTSTGTHGDVVQLHLDNMTTITFIRWEMPKVGFSYQLSGGSRENIPELSCFIWSLNSSEQSPSNCSLSSRKENLRDVKLSGESSLFSHLGGSPHRRTQRQTFLCRHSL